MRQTLIKTAIVLLAILGVVFSIAYFIQKDFRGDDNSLVALENSILESDFRIYFTQDEVGAFVETLQPAADKKSADAKLLSATGIAMAVHASGSGLADDSEARQALSYLQKALVEDPKNTDILDGIGYTHELLGDTDAAVEAYQQAIGIHENARTYSYLGRAYQMKGDENKAAKMFDKALSMNGNFVSAYYFIGRSLAASGKADQAIGAFNRAFEKAVGNGEKSKIIARVAGIYAFSPDDRDKKKVFDNAEEAIRLDPKNAYALSVMGRNYHNLMGMIGEKDNWGKNAKKAEEYANRVRMLSPNETDACEWIGLDLAVFGKYDDATKMFNSGIETAKNSRELSAYERDNYLARFYLYKGMVYANNPEADGNMDAAVKYLQMAVDLRSGLKESVKSELTKGKSGYFAKLKDSSRIQEIVTK